MNRILGPFMDRTAFWWKSVAFRVGRSVLVVLVGFLATGGGLSGINWTVALSTSAMVAVLAFVSALASLPEDGFKQYGKPVAILLRTLRTLGQTLAATLGTATLITDVNWTETLDAAFAAALGTLLLGMVSVLPETEPVVTGLPETEDLPVLVDDEDSDFDTEDDLGFGGEGRLITGNAEE